MYLKRLEIKGFKSFANNTEISLNPGINIIVGPNGCGKSNVVDAIRWVLGEANVRHLRGNKGEDVIFNGTDAKKSLGMAQVEMELDNTDQLVPLDYSEVTVSRKVFRSGESEFYINKSRVRMRDVNDLFTGTGLGKKGYSIISQGELEQVLNGQALDRRLILEEASGIIKHRQQRDEVKRRLENTGNDLLRLGDIIGEVRERREELSHKADKARRYLHLDQECRQLEKNILASEISRAEQDLQRKRDELLQYQINMTMLEQSLSGQEQQLEEEEQKLGQGQRQLSAKQAQEYQAQTELKSLQGELKLSTERIKNRQDRIEQSQADEIKYTDMLNQLDQDLALKSQDYVMQEKDYRQRVEEYGQLEREIAELEQSLNRNQDIFSRERSAVFNKLQEESHLKNWINEKEERFKRLQERKDRLLIRLDEYKNKLKQYNRDHAVLQDEINRYRELLTGYDQELAVMEKQKGKILGQVREAESEYNQLNQEGIRINNRLLAIRERAQNLSGYSGAVKALMRAAANGNLKGIMGIPGEFMDVPAGMELAIETAVGRGLENIVTDTVEHARQSIEFLKTNRLGRVTFLPLDILKSQRLPEGTRHHIEQQQGVIGLASRVVGYDSRYAAAVDYLLGRVLIVEDMNTAIAIFKKRDYSLRIVSLEGELINVSGAVSGGAKPAVAGNSPLLRRGEEKRLLKQQDENFQAQSCRQKQLLDWQNELETVGSAMNVLKQKRMETEMGLELREKQAREIAGGIAEGNREIGSFEQDAGGLEQEMIQLKESMVGARDKLVGIQGDSERVARELEALKEGLDISARDLEVRRERLSSLREQMDMKKKELENIKKNTAQFEQVRQSYLQSAREAQGLRERMVTLNRQEELRGRELDRQISEVSVRAAAVVVEIARIKKELEEWGDNVGQLRRDLLPGRERLAQMERQARNLELALARLETELSAQMIKWNEKFHVAFAPINDVLSYSRIKEGKLVVEQLQAQLEELGLVDSQSIGDFEAIQERFDFLNSQYNDMLQARESLQSLLGETEKLMVGKFAHFLQMADESFNQTFREIFAGGEAHLKVEKGSERLETGVDIEVKLPGKRPQLLNLLSGGEKALTCIAFVFSLLRLKPAPFCLMDEIDASLDEINLTRFSRFLQGMAHKMQFLVITHRQATIEVGEYIYGITMPERGISSILTLDLQEAESLAG